MASPVNLLQLSPTMTEGTIVKWLVKEGDEVSSGMAIAEIETDKAVMEQESFDDGKVLKIYVDEGDRVPVESLLMVIGEEGEDISGFSKDNGGAPKTEEKSDKSEKPEKSEEKQGQKATEAAPEKSSHTPPPAAPASKSSGDSGRQFVSPLARKMAEDAGIDVEQISGSGPNGRVVKKDVEKAIQDPSSLKATTSASSPSPALGATLPEETIKLSGMRQTIARRLVESKQQVPHFQLTVDVRGERLLDAVSQIRNLYPDSKVTVTHFLIKAMGMLAMKHQPIRSQWGGDQLNVLGAGHISVAVAIDEGLLTPVIRNAHALGVIDISNELRRLAKLARDRKLSAEDMSGGVQTLSNLGMFGIKQFNAIVNPPESSILAVGSMDERPVIEDGELVAAKVMTITMSCDHRVVDGAVGAEYLRDLKNCLEEPLLLLV